MSIPFDPKELQIVRRQPSFNPALPGTPAAPDKSKVGRK